MKKTVIFTGISLFALLLSGCMPAPKKKSSNPSGSAPTDPISASSADVPGSDSEDSGDSDIPSSSSSVLPPVDPDHYYDSITDEMSGKTLLNALQTLNAAARTSTVGYSAMGTSASSSVYKYTDYDPTSEIKYDENNQPYGSKILSFYTHTPSISFNREHVWPNSHGGGKKGDVSSPYVDADVYMPRPTIPTENSSRGNSFFVEGMKSDKDGWDPKAAGFSEESRGDAARITFYCMVADSRLVLAPANLSPESGKDPITGIEYGSGHTMGNLEDLLRWNLNYDISDLEERRNSGGQYLQGNRNPFVDHPEYACRIWGTTNANTRIICGIS